MVVLLVMGGQFPPSPQLRTVPAHSDTSTREKFVRGAAAPYDGVGTVALCIFSGGCAGLTPAQIVQKIRSDAAAYNIANLGYGFVGDPLRPVSGKYYGFLIRAGLY